MNIFVAIMLCFSAWGLLDKILGGKLGLMEEFDEGLTTMGSLAVSTVGFYSIGITFVQNHEDAIAAAVQRMPYLPGRWLQAVWGRHWDISFRFFWQRLKKRRSQS